MSPALRRLLTLSLGAWVIASGAIAETPSPISIEAELTPAKGTVGDALSLTLTLDIPHDARLVPPGLGPELGPFTVLDGSWEQAVEEGERTRHVWRARVAAYRTGELELPPITVRIEADGEEWSATSDPMKVTIESVLEQDSASEPPELADLKGPASMPAEYGPLKRAVALLALLFLISMLVWWLVRRYGDRLAARPVPADPFQRVPPHVWAYGELQRLLEQGLPEQGRVDDFYTRLAWILKRYLGGRYRVDLMERTTSELLPLREQAGAPAGSSRDARELLERCDLVKFARELPDPVFCRNAVDDAYRVVDSTKPSQAAEAGAA